MRYVERYFKEVQAIAKRIDLQLIEKMIKIIFYEKKQNGLLFFRGGMGVQPTAPTQ